MSGWVCAVCCVHMATNNIPKSPNQRLALRTHNTKEANTRSNNARDKGQWIDVNSLNACWTCDPFWIKLRWKINSKLFFSASTECVRIHRLSDLIIMCLCAYVKLTWNNILQSLTLTNEIEHQTLNTFCGFNVKYPLHDFQFDIRANGKSVELSKFNFEFRILCELHLQYYRLAAQMYAVCYRIEMWNWKERVQSRADGRKGAKKTLHKSPLMFNCFEQMNTMSIMEYSMVYGARCCASFTKSIRMQVIQMEISREKGKCFTSFSIDPHNKRFKTLDIYLYFFFLLGMKKEKENGKTDENLIEPNKNKCFSHCSMFNGNCIASHRVKRWHLHIFLMAYSSHNALWIRNLECTLPVLWHNQAPNLDWLFVDTISIPNDNKTTNDQCSQFNLSVFCILFHFVRSFVLFDGSITPLAIAYDAIEYRYIFILLYAIIICICFNLKFCWFSWKLFSVPWSLVFQQLHPVV